MPIKGVPLSLTHQVLDAFLGQLRNHPLLANGRAVKTWITWDGQGPINPPPESEMPACQVWLLGGPVRRLCSARAPGGPMMGISESKLQVVIDLYTPGTDQRDLADVAALIDRALAPRDHRERAALGDRFRRAGIKDWRKTREILPGSAESFAQLAIAGQGAYELTVHSYS